MMRAGSIEYGPQDIDRLRGEGLLQAAQKLNEKIPGDKTPEKMGTLLRNLQAMQGRSGKISIPGREGLMLIPVDDIIRCQSSINYTIIMLKDKQKITVAKTLKAFERLLVGYHFFRVHQSHLINLDYIKCYRKGKGGSVLMTDQSEVAVATRRKEAFLKRLTSL